MDFFFVGPQKTGTTWLYENLKVHPDICFPKGVKETMFFDRNFERGLDWYREYFTRCRDADIIGEVAPTYFDAPEVPERINNFFPSSKIIISLRDPVERTRSLYNHHYRKGRVSASLMQAIQTKPEIMTSSYFAEHIPRWLHFFDESQVLVISLNEIDSNPERLLNKICSFLAIQSLEWEKNLMERKIYKALAPRFPIFTRLGSRLASLLHSLRLHYLVMLAKKLGLEKFFFKKSSEKLTLSADEEKFIEEKFSPHILYVKEKFGENIL